MKTINLEQIKKELLEENALLTWAINKLDESQNNKDDVLISVNNIREKLENLNRCF